jgi:hypothetical protein
VGQTCRDELLKAATAVFHLSGESNFTLAEILEEMHRRGSRYADSTIRTHVTSKMCANAPVHHANHTDDFERVGRGVYRSADRPAVRISYPRETSTPDTPQPATASEPFRLEPKSSRCKNSRTVGAAEMAISASPRQGSPVPSGVPTSETRWLDRVPFDQLLVREIDSEGGAPL